MLSLLDVRRQNGSRWPLPIEEVYRANVASRAEIEAEREYEREAARLAMNGESRYAQAVHADLVRRTAEACIPLEFRSVALDLRHTEALEKGVWLYIHGPVGSGKSTMAAGTLRGWMASYHGTARWAFEPDMLTDIRGARERWEAEDEALWRYTGPRVLVLDDVGSERPALSAARLKQVIDARWREHRPTIITSQHDVASLCSLIGQVNPDASQAIGSRLSRCTRVRLAGPDRRLA